MTHAHTAKRARSRVGAEGRSQQILVQFRSRKGQSNSEGAEKPEVFTKFVLRKENMVSAFTISTFLPLPPHITLFTPPHVALLTLYTLITLHTLSLITGDTGGSERAVTGDGLSHLTTGLCRIKGRQSYHHPMHDCQVTIM